MNPELQALEKMLQMGLKSKADLAGLDEQHALASALRDTPDYKGNSRGQQSIFGHLANIVQRNTGKRQLKELAGQREAARANVAAAGNALPMYKLQQEQKAIELAKNNQDYERGGLTGLKSMWSANGDEVQIALDDRGRPINPNTFEPMDITGLLSENPLVTASQITKNNNSGSGSGSGLAPSSTAQALYLKQQQLKDDMEAATAIYEGLGEDGLAELNQPIKQGLKSFFVPDEAQRMIETQMYNDPEAKDYMGRLARLESTFSEMISGKAVSGFEMKDRQKWSINAAGIDDAERQRRVKRMLQEVKNQTAKYEDYYPDYKLNRASDTPSDSAVDDFTGWSITEVEG